MGGCLTHPRAILESLKHRNIVQLTQKILDPSKERIYIIMEVRRTLRRSAPLLTSQYCPSGDLSTLIRKAQRSGQPLHEDKIWSIFLQITLALHHCHWPTERSSPTSRLGGSPESSSVPPRTQVLHRDLKPENGWWLGVGGGG